MSERGGPTTQSGILYQNSITALYLGRMCDAAQRPDSDRVNAVRVEAPEDVDDIVVTFADDHRDYIQAKENVRDNQRAWCKLWSDFDAQFRRAEFRRGRDRLILRIGEIHQEHHDLQELCCRALTSENYLEWQRRLTKGLRNLLEKIKPLLSPEMLSDSTLLAFFGHVDVEILSLIQIERDAAPLWMPKSNKLPVELFHLLRDRVGGAGRIRASFTLPVLRDSLADEHCHLIEPPDIDSLREAVSRCGAILRQHKHTIAKTGRHLRRGVVEDILIWARGNSGEDNVGMLLDRAGMGKSVVARDVLVALDEADLTALAIKADQQLSGINSHEDLQARLGLPEPVERIVGRLSTLGPVVVLIDQIDALSLSLARDQKALDVILELVARLRLISGVRILLSCRTFDRNSDPRLRNIEVKKEFILTELPDGEIEEVLRSVGVEIGSLSPATQKLLRVPLHLNLFAMAMEGKEEKVGDAQVYRGITSLQDLYAFVWQYIILKTDSGGPPTHDRLEVLRLITTKMHCEQRTSVPRTFFAKPESSHLENVVQWLASEAILVASPTELGFLHQTFFDYCYARQFVEDGGKLAESIIGSEQGLSARPLLIHVLSYHRGGDPRAYLAELQDLLDAEGLRFHLQDLLLRWFGSLSDPTDGEWSVAYRRLNDPATRPRLLAAMGGNIGWFAKINGGPLHVLLAQDDQVLDTQVVPYLISMLGVSQEDVITIARRLAAKGGPWTNRAARIASRIRDWKSAQAVEFFEQLAASPDNYLIDQTHHLHEIVKQHPRVGCRLIRRLLDRALQNYKSQREDRSRPHSLLRGELEHRISIHFKVLGTAAQAEPAYFIECLLPWLEEVVGLTDGPTKERPYYSHDELCHNWHDNIFYIQYYLILAIVAALVGFAQSDIEGFRCVVSRLAMLPYMTPQKLLAQVYRLEPKLLAADALDFLLGDRRRLGLGDREQYESRQLIKAIYPVLTDQERARLEWFIIDSPKPKKHLGLYGLRIRGLDQLYLLQAIPIEYLTERGLSHLDELKRKFPGFSASDDPRTIRVSRNESPILQEKTAKMTDRDWLLAMRKYREGVRYPNSLKGGAQELGGVLLQSVKEDPERFYRLVGRVEDSVVAPYAGTVLNGLAESSAPSERLFDVARRFASLPISDIRSDIARALKRRVESGLPNDLVDLLEAWVRDRSIPSNEERGDPYAGYMNSVRGTAFGAPMQALDQRGTAEARDRKWELIEFVSRDPSTTLRAGAIEELLYLMGEDRERGIALFERLMDGHAALLRSPYVTHEFLYRGFYKNFGRIKPFLRALMNEDKEEQRQRGAELACIAAICPLALESADAQAEARQLAEEVLTGLPPWRRGSASLRR